MSRIKFPSDPYDGEEYTNAGRTWVYNGAIPAWRPKKAEVLTKDQVLTVSSTQPLTPAQKQVALQNLGAVPVARTSAQGAPDESVIPTVAGQLCIVGDDPEEVATYVAVQVSPPVWVLLRSGPEIEQSIPPSDEGFSVTPRAELKTFIAEEATIDDLVDIVATLLVALKSKQVI